MGIVIPMKQQWSMPSKNGSTTYVYDYPSGNTPNLYIDGDYVFPMSGSSLHFGSMGTTGIPTHGS